MEEVRLPELGEGVNEAVVSCWYFDEGDEVEEGEDLLEMVTDKATFNMPAPISGILTKKYFEEGETVKAGETMAVIEEK